MNIAARVKRHCGFWSKFCGVLWGHMLSAIVIALPGTPALPIVRTLTALVPAAVQGLVRDLTLACPPGREFEEIADHAGCRLAAHADAAAALAAAIAGARENWLLLLLAGFAPESGFVEEAGDFVADGRERAGQLRRIPDGLWTRLFPDLAPVAGVLAPKALLGQGGDFAARAAHVAPRQTFRVRARRVL